MPSSLKSAACERFGQDRVENIRSNTTKRHATRVSKIEDNKKKKGARKNKQKQTNNENDKKSGEQLSQ